MRYPRLCSAFLSLQAKIRRRRIRPRRAPHPPYLFRYRPGALHLSARTTAAVRRAIHSQARLYSRRGVARLRMREGQNSHAPHLSAIGNYSRNEHARGCRVRQLTPARSNSPTPLPQPAAGSGRRVSSSTRHKQSPAPAALHRSTESSKTTARSVAATHAQSAARS